MKTLQDVGLSEKDIALSRWSIFDSLATEEDIALYLKAAMLDIEEGLCDAGFIFDALADAAKARAINQLAKETGLDRKLFYNIEPNSKIPKISHDAIVRVVEAFAIPVMV
jgi:probable addiction module antidote protein